jgi:hypothetical protein
MRIIPEPAARQENVERRPETDGSKHYPVTENKPYSIRPEKVEFYICKDVKRELARSFAKPGTVRKNRNKPENFSP